MKRYIRSNRILGRTYDYDYSKVSISIYASSKMFDIHPIAKNSAEYRKLETNIWQEYKSICPYYKYEDLFSFFYKGRWKNTDNGIQFITTTWMLPDDNLAEYDENILKPVPLEYVYRAVSIPEYEYILKTGQIKSNLSMNLGDEVTRGLTCYHTSFPGWYLPENGGYILKVKVTPDMFLDDRDEYIKTSSPVSINNIVEVNGIPV